MFLEISQNSQENNCDFLIIKKETLAQVFSCEFCEISKNTYFIEHLWWNTRTEAFLCASWEKGILKVQLMKVFIAWREKNDSVYSPTDRVVLMRQIKTKNVTKNAKLLDHSKFLDVIWYSKQFSNFRKDENGTFFLNWKKVRILMAKKSDLWILFFKNQYNQPVSNK